MLSICTFGGLAIKTESDTIAAKLGRVPGELFAYLCIHQKLPHRRERLAELFWPEKSAQRSRSSLNSALWRIGTALADGGIGQQINLQREMDAAVSIRFGDSVCIDCTELRTAVAACELEMRNTRSLCPQMRQSLRSAVDSYAGPFLDGSDVDWILRERENLNCLYVRGLTLLMHSLAGLGRFEEAIGFGREILALDELREATQREIMWLYVMNGQRCEAIAQFNGLRRRLKQELDIEPMAETMLLYRYVLEDAAHTPDIPIGNDLSHDAVTSVADAMRECHQQRATFYVALTKA